MTNKFEFIFFWITAVSCAIAITNAKGFRRNTDVGNIRQSSIDTLVDKVSGLKNSTLNLADAVSNAGGTMTDTLSGGFDSVSAFMYDMIAYLQGEPNETENIETEETQATKLQEPATTEKAEVVTVAVTEVEQDDAPVEEEDVAVEEGDGERRLKKMQRSQKCRRRTAGKRKSSFKKKILLPYGDSESASNFTDLSEKFNGLKNSSFNMADALTNAKDVLTGTFEEGIVYLSGLMDGFTDWLNEKAAEEAGEKNEGTEVKKEEDEVTEKGTTLSYKEQLEKEAFSYKKHGPVEKEDVREGEKRSKKHRPSQRSRKRTSGQRKSNV